MYSMKCPKHMKTHQYSQYSAKQLTIIAFLRLGKMVDKVPSSSVFMILHISSELKRAQIGINIVKD